MARKRKHYSKEFKIDAVKLINEQGYKISEAARNLGIHHSSLRRWKDELDTNSSQAFPGKGHIRPEKEELYRLRKECHGSGGVHGFVTEPDFGWRQRKIGQRT